ncbi:unnamed protein product [Sympodiomycopsis kandeliae]
MDYPRGYHPPSPPFTPHAHQPRTPHAGDHYTSSPVTQRARGFSSTAAPISHHVAPSASASAIATATAIKSSSPPASLGLNTYSEGVPSSRFSIGNSSGPNFVNRSADEWTSRANLGPFGGSSTSSSSRASDGAGAPWSASPHASQAEDSRLPINSVSFRSPSESYPAYQRETHSASDSYPHKSYHTSPGLIGGIPGQQKAQPSYSFAPSPYAKAGVDMHPSSLGSASNSSTPEFSIFVADLSPDLREEDLVTQFLHPPPWPPHHPFAASYAEARMAHGEPVSSSEVFGPSPFLSTKSAKIMTDPTTGTSRSYGFVRFTSESDCKRAMIEMQGVVLTPASGASPGRPVRISPASVKQKSGHNTATSPMSEIDSPYAAEMPTGGEDNYHFMQLRNASTDAIGSWTTRPRYTSPTPASIASQSSRVQHPSRLGVPTLPGFPTIPATGALGPTDVGSSAGLLSGSSYGGPASLAGTGFTLGPSTLPSPSSALDPNNTTVFVGGLSSLISEETLKTFFAPFGMIAYVKIPPGKGCGFVSFTQKVDAERAIERMQGFPIGGCRIRLSWGRSQGEKNQHIAAQHIASMSHLAQGTYNANRTEEMGFNNTFGSLSPQQEAQLARVGSWGNLAPGHFVGANAEALDSDADADAYLRSFGYPSWSDSMRDVAARASANPFEYSQAVNNRESSFSTSSMMTAHQEAAWQDRVRLESARNVQQSSGPKSLTNEGNSNSADLSVLFGNMSVGEGRPTPPSRDRTWSSPWERSGQSSSNWPLTSLTVDTKPGASPSKSSSWSSYGIDSPESLRRDPRDKYPSAIGTPARSAPWNQENADSGSAQQPGTFSSRPSSLGAGTSLSAVDLSAFVPRFKQREPARADTAGSSGGESSSGLTFRPFSPLIKESNRLTSSDEETQKASVQGQGELREKQ